MSGPAGSGKGAFTFEERTPEEGVTLYRVYAGSGDTLAAGEGPRSEVATSTAG